MQIRGREGVVDDQEGPRGVGDLGDAGQVRDAQVGIRRGLDPDHPGLGADRRGHGVDGTHVHRGGAADAGENLLEEPAGPAVDVLAEQDVPPRRQRPGHRVLRGHARGEGEAVRGLLERRQGRLQGAPGGIGRTGVLVALVGPHLLLDVGGGLVDGDDRRPGRWVGVLPHVDGPGLEPHARTRYLSCLIGSALPLPPV